METMTLWFVQKKGWVSFDRQNDWYTAKGPFRDEGRAWAWIDKQTHLSWGGRDGYRIVKVSLPFEVVES